MVPAAQYQVSPPSQAVAPSNKKKLVIIAVIAIVVIAALAAAVVLSSSGGASSGGSSARDCLEKLETYNNNRDYDELVDCTIGNFLSEQDQKDLAEEFENTLFDVRTTFSNIRTVPRSEIGQTDIDDIEAWIDELEAEIDKTVGDWVVLEYDTTVRDRSTGDIVNSNTDSRPVFVEIGSRWYLLGD
jgi:hypothetical protein